jgi:hypothetical protein
LRAALDGVEKVFLLCGPSAGAADSLLKHYVGTDRDQGYLTNTSIWDSLDHARQMDSFAPMLAQRPLLKAAGIRVEPITSHETIWRISSGDEQ